MSKSFRLVIVISVVVAIGFFLRTKFDNEDETPVVPDNPMTPAIELVDTPVLIVSNDKDENFVPENLPKIPESIPEIPDPVKVSRIRITKSSSVDTVLSIADVRLFNNGARVPLKGGKATQSSTFQDKTIYGPGKGIDGVDKFNVSGKSVASTKLGKKHWWNVLFKDHVDATEIKIFNNKDGLAFLKGSILKVFDENSKVILQKTLSRNSIQTYSLI